MKRLTIGLIKNDDYVFRLYHLALWQGGEKAEKLFKPAELYEM